LTGGLNLLHYSVGREAQAPEHISLVLMHLNEMWKSILGLLIRTCSYMPIVSISYRCLLLCLSKSSTC